MKASETLLEIVESLRDLDSAGVTEVAAHLDMPKSTAHKHLATLEEMEYVTNDNGIYGVGLKFLRLGDYARTQSEMYQMAKPIVEQLAKETNERSQFIVEEHGKGVFVHRQIGQNAVHTNTNIGKRIHLHSTGAGKAILANLPSERTEEIIETIGLPAQTEQTVTDPDELKDELEVIRERGYAFNKEEGMRGLRTVGVPVLNPSGQVFGAFSVSGPSHRMSGEIFNDEIPNLLLGKANEYELKIEFES